MTPVPQHTPGPWWFELHFVAAADPDDGLRTAWIADAVLYDEHGCVASLETRKANRRLIAAAPDLFGLVYRLAYTGAPFSEKVDDARALVEKICGDPGPFTAPGGESPGDQGPVEPKVNREGTHDPERNAEDSEDHFPDEVHSDPELWFDICNDPAIWPENRAAAYRAALRGERNWRFASIEDLEGAEETDVKTVGRNSRPSYLRRVR